MLSVEATINLRTEEEGGLIRPGFSGMQPSMDINGELVACKILEGFEGNPLGLGQEHDVQIDPAYGERFSNVRRAGFLFNLNVGGRIIGRGQIL